LSGETFRSEAAAKRARFSLDGPGNHHHSLQEYITKHECDNQNDAAERAALSYNKGRGCLRDLYI
jgi:hypothetical protein